MQFYSVEYRIKRFYRVTCLRHFWEMISKNAQQRLKTLIFSDQHSIAIPFGDAFEISYLNPVSLAMGTALGQRHPCYPDYQTLYAKAPVPQTSPPPCEKSADCAHHSPTSAKPHTTGPVATLVWAVEHRTTQRLYHRAHYPFRFHKMRHTPARLGARDRHKPLSRKYKTCKTRKPKGCQAPTSLLKCSPTIP